MNKLQLIKTEILDIYKQKQKISLLKHFNKIKKQNVNKDLFGYSIPASAVFSSMIEGNNIDFDTYLKFRDTGMNTKSKSYIEIQELITAYNFAIENKLNEKNILKAHAIITNSIIQEKKYQGKYRDKNVFIYASGEKIYTGTKPEFLHTELNKFFADIDILLNRELTMQEIFYFASMIHIVFVKIHPFADGNGRTARLIEKWFLSQKLSSNAWNIPSEKLYQNRIKSYYENLEIGKTYETVNFNSSLKFLLMLPMALRIK